MLFQEMSQVNPKVKRPKVKRHFRERRFRGPQFCAEVSERLQPFDGGRMAQDDHSPPVPVRGALNITSQPSTCPRVCCVNVRGAKQRASVSPAARSSDCRNNQL